MMTIEEFANAFFQSQSERVCDPNFRSAGTDHSLLDFLPVDLPPPPKDEVLLMPSILAKSLESKSYNSQSDRHSRIKCVGLMLDLLRAIPELETWIRQGFLTFGINSKVYGKYLDLVIGTPSSNRRKKTLTQLGRESSMVTTSEEKAALAQYDDLYEGSIEQVWLAVEAKAVMTEHSKAIARVTSELTAFRQLITEHRPQAITVGLGMINVSAHFVSSVRNSLHIGAPIITYHQQPKDAQRVITAFEGLTGFDAVGAVFLDCPNDGSQVTAILPKYSELTYPKLVQQISNLVQNRWVSGPETNSITLCCPPE